MLPATLMQMAHLPSGAQVDVEVMDDRIVLKAALPREAESVRIVRKGKRFVVRGLPKPYDAVAALKAEREERDAKLARVVSGK